MILNKYGEYKISFLIVAILCLMVAGNYSERVYKQNYDKLGPNCEARFFCPKWFLAVGFVSGVCPFLTMLFIIVLGFRLYSVLYCHTKGLYNYFKLEQIQDGGEKKNGTTTKKSNRRKHRTTK